jgi:hypothetical protein
MVDGKGRQFPVPYILPEAFEGDTEPSVYVYKWRYNFPDAPADSIDGYFRFWKSGKDIYLISTPSDVEGYIWSPLAKVEVEEGGKVLRWVFGSQTETIVRFDAKGKLLGASRDARTGEIDYWTAVPVSTSDMPAAALTTIAGANQLQLDKVRASGLVYFEPSDNPYKVAGDVRDLTKTTLD